MSGLKETLKHVVEQGGVLSREEARDALTWMLASDSPDSGMEIASLLTALATRGETADELTGFVEAMRKLALSGVAVRLE